MFSTMQKKKITKKQQITRRLTRLDSATRSELYYPLPKRTPDKQFPQTELLSVSRTKSASFSGKLKPAEPIKAK